MLTIARVVVLLGLTAVINAAEISRAEVKSYNDYTNLIDMVDTFKFIINQSPCQRTPKTLAIVLVHSSPKNFERRLVIRHTWGSFRDYRMRILFLLGAVESEDLQNRLEHENYRFGDMIQGNFIDEYRNLTYKHVMGLKWFTYFCAETPIMVKADDDVFINTPTLLEYVLRNTRSIRTRPPFVMCTEWIGMKVIRSPSKWQVSEQEYPNATYPPYCSGYTIMYSTDAAQKIYKKAQQSPYFWIDDMHVTGALMKDMDVSRIGFGETSFDPVHAYRLTHQDIGQRPIFGFLDKTPGEIKRLWYLVAGQPDENAKMKMHWDRVVVEELKRGLK